MASALKVIEQKTPFFLGALAALLAMLLPDALKLRLLTSVADPVITVSAIAVGFVSTVESIILAMRDSQIVDWLRESTGLHKFHRYMMAAIGLSFAVVAFSVTGKLLDPTQLPCWFPYAVSAWVGLCIWASSACLRVVIIFGLVIDDQTS